MPHTGFYAGRDRADLRSIPQELQNKVSVGRRLCIARLQFDLRWLGKNCSE
jgi:hypothetical protein